MKKSLNDELERLAKEFQALTNGLPSSVQEVIDDFIFTKKEETAWKHNEPDFAKQIAKPLARKRKGHFMLAVLLLSLTLPHLMVTNSPNGLPHPHPPNANDTLPYVTIFISDCY